MRRAEPPTFDPRWEWLKQGRRRLRKWLGKRRTIFKNWLAGLWDVVWSPQHLFAQGWAWVTFAIGSAVGHWQIVISASIGLLLFSLYGWAALYQTIRLGLRGLSKLPRENPEDE